jgi:uncharacterized protein
MNATLIHKNQIIDQLRILKPELEERYGVVKIGIFGSLARNESHDRSDIDIVVEMLPDLLKRASLKEYLEKLFNKEVDVVRYWYGMNPYLKTRIEQEALYA